MNFFENAVVLVTGRSGTIGSHVVDAAIAEGARKVIVYDNFSPATTRISRTHSARSGLKSNCAWPTSRTARIWKR